MGFQSKRTQAKTSLPLGVELEYKTLRDEILLRINLRQQHIQHALLFFGGLVGVGLQSNHPHIASLYPPLAFFLALGWLQTDLRIRYISNYIAIFIEPCFATKGWETSIRSILSNDPTTWRVLTISHAGVFFITQVLAILVGLKTPIKLIMNELLMSRFFSIGVRLGALSITPIDWALLIFDSLCTLGVLLIWVKSIRRNIVNN